ncbi:MAG: hypothetical protein ACOYKA_01130 [Legionellaceae bacterium]
MAFTLTVLGTDTPYLARDHLKKAIISYPDELLLCESLSLISERIVDAEPLPLEDATAFFDSSMSFVHLDEDGKPSASVFDTATMTMGIDMSGVFEVNKKASVMEGPDTLGFNVYEKIAKGTLDLLKAVAQGETTLNIIGHSRGAVESILIAHELDRIQKVMWAEPCSILTVEQFKTLICDSPDKKTKKKLRELLKKTKGTSDFYETLMEKFRAKDKHALHVNIFAVDPVPGGGSYGSDRVTSWVDARFFTIPDMVKHYKQIVMEDERSSAFEVIIPKVMNPETTSFELINLPGHHGTATGNPYDQNERKVLRKDKTPQNPNDTRDVQYMTLCLIHDFLSQHGVFFNTTPEKVGPEGVFNFYHLLSPTEKDEFRLECYQDILKHREKYRAFKDTCYATGKNQYLWSFVKSIKDERIVHHHQFTRTYLDSICPTKTDFVNADHVLLYLNVTLGLNIKDLSIAGQLNNLIQRLNRLNVSDAALTAALNEKGSQVIECIQGLVTGVVQVYLRNNLSTEDHDEILGTIRNLLTMHSVSDEEASLAGLKDGLKKKLIEHLFSGVESQVTSHFDALSVLVHQLNSDEVGESDMDLTSVSCSKYEEMKQFEVQLTSLIEGLPWEESHQQKLSHYRNKLARYSEALKFFCAQALVKAGRAELAERHDFNRDVNHIAQGLRGDGAYARSLQARIAVLREENLDLKTTLQVALQEGEAARGFNVQAMQKIDILRGLNQEIIAELQGERALHDQAVEERDAALALHHQAVEERDAALALHDQAVEERDAALALHDQAVEERDAALALHHQAVEERDAAFALHQQVVQEGDASRALHEQMVEEHDALAASVAADVRRRAADAERAWMDARHNHAQNAHGLTLEILGGFAAILGGAVVSLAIVALLFASVPVVPAAMMMTAGLLLSGAGMFGVREGARRQTLQEVFSLQM